MLSRSHRLLLAALILAGLAIPLVWYWWAVGRAPTMEVQDARHMVDDSSAILVAVDPLSEVEGHAWPVSSILLVRTPDELPRELAGRKLLLLCKGGVHSAQAAMHLTGVGIPGVYSIRGGWQEWISAVPGCPAGVNLSRDPAANAAVPLFRPSPLHEQWAVIIAFFGVKTVYSVLAAGIWYLLRRSRAADLIALRWSMLFFFIGEGFCFINVMAFQEHSMLLEHLHSVGMVISLGFAYWAAIEAVDARILHFSDEQRCAMTLLCRGCVKRANMPCGLRRTFLMMIPVLAVIAIMPLFSELRATAYNTRVFAALHSYRHPILHQLYEVRYLPVAAVLLFSAAMLVLLLKEKRPVPVSKLLTAAGLGAMSFSLLRLFLITAYEQNQVWFAFWEEGTELLYIGAVAGVLWAFRKGLFESATREGETVATGHL